MKILSKCCKAPIKRGGVPDFIGDDQVCTVYNVCTECGEACDGAPEDFWSEKSVVAEKETTKTSWEEEFNKAWGSLYVRRKQKAYLDGPAHLTNWKYKNCNAEIKAFITKVEHEAYTRGRCDEAKTCEGCSSERIKEAKAEGRREGIEECVEIVRKIGNREHVDSRERLIQNKTVFQIYKRLESLLNPSEKNLVLASNITLTLL